jgi:hypothetical protein
MNYEQSPSMSSGAESRGVKKGQLPSLTSQKFSLLLVIFFLNILVAHPQLLIKGQIIFQKIYDS